MIGRASCLKMSNVGVDDCAQPPLCVVSVVLWVDEGQRPGGRSAGGRQSMGYEFFCSSLLLARPESINSFEFLRVSIWSSRLGAQPCVLHAVVAPLQRCWRAGQFWPRPLSGWKIPLKCCALGPLTGLRQPYPPTRRLSLQITNGRRRRGLTYMHMHTIHVLWPATGAEREPCGSIVPPPASGMSVSGCKYVHIIVCTVFSRLPASAETRQTRQRLKIGKVVGSDLVLFFSVFFFRDSP